MQCELMYFMHMSLDNIEDCDLTELKWCHQWLADQKRQEAEQLEKSIRG